MEHVRATPRALDLADPKNQLLERLKEIQDRMHSLQVRVSAAVDRVVVEFPRLVLQPLLHKYLKKSLSKLAGDLGYVFLFKRLEIKENTIVGLKNQEGEVLPLVAPIKTEGKTVVQILKEIESGMRLSLKKVLETAIVSYNDKELGKWCRQQVLQCSKVARAVHWSHRVEQAMKAIDPKALQQVCAEGRAQLLELVKFCRTAEDLREKSVATQMLQVIYWNVDVTQTLIDRMVRDTASYEWQRYFRYYWQENNCLVRCGDWAVLYGYEFLGKSASLVWTPETSNAFYQLMGALRTNSCSAVVGGSGSGKADMVVDMAKSLGRFYHLVEVTRVVATQLNIYASNCAAATYAGGFAIFNIGQIDDNFIALAELLEKIAAASMMGYREYVVEKCGGLPMVLSPKFGLVMCISPAGTAGNEWLEKSRGSFRNIYVQPPDQKLITAYTLYSYGFEKGTELGTQIVKAFALFSRAFSKVPYYDHSIRSILNVVSLMQALRKSLAPKPLSEEQLAVRALTSFIQTRLLTKDVEAFQNIVNELFPKVDISNTYDEKLFNGIKDVCKKEKLSMNEPLLKRVYELLELIQLKGPCFVAIGHHGSGKTTCCRVLARLLNELSGGQKVQTIEVKHELEDKYEELFYETDTAGKVKPGKILKPILEARQGSNKWVILKGPLTPNLQEFLADLMQGRLIISGTRVEIHPTNKVIIEESDANNQLIRPAFASRCCFLSFDPKVHIAKYTT